MSQPRTGFCEDCGPDMETIPKNDGRWDYWLCVGCDQEIAEDDLDPVDDEDLDG